jgi:hypothetical protein
MIDDARNHEREDYTNMSSNKNLTILPTAAFDILVSLGKVLLVSLGKVLLVSLGKLLLLSLGKVLTSSSLRITQ